jgi:signal transduction histidine kinase/ActR/RegA family two-component response regulator/PAS domain-containing protein
MSSVLQIGDIGAPLDQVFRSLAAEGLDVLDSPPEHLTEMLREQQFAAAVIAPDVVSPVGVARAVHVSSPEAHIVFVTDDAREAGLRRQLLLAPRIGTHWTVVKANLGDAAAAGIRNAVADALRRRQHRTTIARLNRRLSTPAHASPRRRIITDQFIAAVFDQISDAIVMLEADGRIITANAAAARLFGRDLPAGLPLAELLDGDLPAEGELREMRARRDGAELVLEVRLEGVHDDRGTRVGTTAVARDVTGRRREQTRRETLARATERLAETLDMKVAMQRLADVVVENLAAVCVIDILDGSTFLREAAAAAPRIGAANVEMLLAYAPRAQAHPAFSAIRGETLVRNGVGEEQWRSLTADETHLAIIRRAGLCAYLTAPLRAGQKVIGAMTLLRDTEAGDFSAQDVELAEELARRAAITLQNAWLYQTAEQANRAKDEFLATLSHELRTPMTSILGWVQMLRLGDLDEASVKDGLDVMEQSARVQAQLIDDLLDLSRGQMGKLHLQMGAVQLGDIVRAAIETLRPAANAKDIALELRVESDVLITADPNRLQQVVWNLLSNSVKFTEKGGAVTVIVDRANSKARVRVSDTGRGIAPEFLPYVFERFRQADSATTRRFGGLGLGLAIVKQLVELHGGTVAVESEGEGKGATFTVALPIPAVRADVAETFAASELLRGLSVLIVEDDTLSAITLRKLLEHSGASVETCNSVAGALEMLRGRIPDVLVSDIAMPGEDGFALIRQVRSTLRISAEQLPAIALTAFGDVKTRVNVLGAGFQRHLQKPIDARALVTAVAGVAKRS